MSRAGQQLDLWGLAERADAPALIDARSGATMSYRALHERVRELAARLVVEAVEADEARRGLVFVAAGLDVGTVVAYLAALAARHAVFLFNRTSNAALQAELHARYRPDFVLSADGAEVSLERAHDHALDQAALPLHPSLSVLLSTSGTTGSPKLVRLSRENVLANARSIARYLALDAQERAISSLPFHYSYGLSVLNSHLFVGASVVVSDASVMRPELWASMREHGCTSFAGVPYAYQIMRRIGFEKLELPTLRTMTQAGGKLPAAQIIHFDQLMKARGGRFFAMYGQTEATARMSYLPPSLLPEHAGSIGVAIPEGSLHVIDLQQGHELTQPGETGELEYRGPNVMLGYASTREDLSLGDVQGGALRTGDLGHRDERGLYYVTGRLKRFAKVYGLRINLDEVEDRMRQHGPAAVVSDDERLTIYCEFGDDALYETLRSELATLYQLNVNTFRLRRIEALPLLASGKMDYDALRQRTR